MSNSIFTHQNTNVILLLLYLEYFAECRRGDFSYCVREDETRRFQKVSEEFSVNFTNYLRHRSGQKLSTSGEENEYDILLCLTKFYFGLTGGLFLTSSLQARHLCWLLRRWRSQPWTRWSIWSRLYAHHLRRWLFNLKRILWDPQHRGLYIETWLYIKISRWKHRYYKFQCEHEMGTFYTSRLLCANLCPSIKQRKINFKFNRKNVSS